MSDTAPVIVWYRDDLRVNDHAALDAAAEHGGPLIAVFVLDDERAGAWRPGGASRWWLHHSLASLDADLRRRGGALVIRRGDTVDHLADIARTHAADALFFHRRYEPHEIALEDAIQRALADELTLRRLRGRLLVEPERIQTKAGDPYRVFTPFYRALLAMDEPAEPGPGPARLAPPPRDIDSLTLDDLELLPTRPDWAGGLREAWSPGEKGAWARLESFLDGAATGYRDQRDVPGTPGTSRLSPHLHFGELSPRQVWHTVRSAQSAVSALTGGGDAFLRELAWREFCHHLLFHWPSLPDKPFNERFANFPWRDDDEAFNAWCHGRTGYPLVDAGMRELWQSGWMHNRVRMVSASFLVKHLLVPWQRGEAWFWDTLVDADLANNSAGWQWVAGCGADAAPYFRIFNPIRQGEKFDAGGDYVRRWVPELASLPDRDLHAPFRASSKTLADAGVRLGDDYPEPIVAHDAARQRALAAFGSTG